MAGNSERGAASQRRRSRGLYATVPVVLVGTLAIASMNLTGSLDVVAQKRPLRTGSDATDPGKVRIIPPAFTAAAEPQAPLTIESVPASYVVRGGDTVSAIAARHGLAVATVLAINGLSARSLIFPGQVLALGRTVPVQPAAVVAHAQVSAGAKYRIVTGDTIGRIASRFGVSVSAILQANGLIAGSIIYTGRTLTIPGTTAPAAVVVAPVVTAPVISAPVGSAPAVPTVTTSYTIASGDTITSIARRFGVTVQAILTANGLNGSSIIYAGRTVVIPGAPGATPAATQTAQFGASITPLSPEMQGNVLAIIAAGKRIGVPSYGIIVALAAAAQESGLRNLVGGDRDSIGLFQQRPSTGWGTAAQLSDPSYASRLFFGGPTNPNKGKTRGLLDIAGWQSMSVSQAAQAVQISAYPSAYAKWELSARAWYSALS